MDRRFTISPDDDDCPSPAVPSSPSLFTSPPNVESVPVADFMNERRKSIELQVKVDALRPRVTQLENALKRAQSRLKILEDGGRPASNVGVGNVGGSSLSARLSELHSAIAEAKMEADKPLLKINNNNNRSSLDSSSRGTSPALSLPRTPVAASFNESGSFVSMMDDNSEERFFLKSRLVELELEARGKDNEIHQLEHTVAFLREQLMLARDENPPSKDDRQEAECLRLQNELKSQSDSMLEQCREHEREIEVSKLRIFRLESALGVCLNLATEIVDSAERVADAAKVAAKATGKEIQMFENETKEALDGMFSREQVLLDQIRDMEESTKRYESQIELLERELAVLKEKRNDGDGNGDDDDELGLGELQSRIRELEANETNHLQKLEANESYIQELEEELKHNEEILMDDEQRMAELLGQIHKLSDTGDRETQKLKAQVIELETREEKRKGEMSSLKAILKGLKSQLQESDEDISELMQDLKRSEDEKGKIEVANAVLRKQLMEIENRQKRMIQGYEQQIQEMKQEIDIMEEEYEQQIVSIEQNRQQDVEKCKQDLHKVVMDYEVQMEDLEAEHQRVMAITLDTRDEKKNKGKKKENTSNKDFPWDFSPENPGSSEAAVLESISEQLALSVIHESLVSLEQATTPTMPINGVWELARLEDCLNSSAHAVQSAQKERNAICSLFDAANVPAGPLLDRALMVLQAATAAVTTPKSAQNHHSMLLLNGNNGSDDDMTDDVSTGEAEAVLAAVLAERDELALKLSQRSHANEETYFTDLEWHKQRAIQCDEIAAKLSAERDVLVRRVLRLCSWLRGNSGHFVSSPSSSTSETPSLIDYGEHVLLRAWGELNGLLAEWVESKGIPGHPSASSETFLDKIVGNWPQEQIEHLSRRVAELEALLSQSRRGGMDHDNSKDNHSSSSSNSNSSNSNNNHEETEVLVLKRKIEFLESAARDQELEIQSLVTSAAEKEKMTRNTLKMECEAGVTNIERKMMERELEHAKELEDLQQLHEQHISDLKHQTEAERLAKESWLLEERERSTAALQREHEEEMKMVKREHEVAVALLTSDHESAMETLMQLHGKEVYTLRQNLKNEERQLTEKLQRDHEAALERSIADWKVRLEDAVAEKYQLEMCWVEVERQKEHVLACLKDLCNMSIQGVMAASRFRRNVEEQNLHSIGLLGIAGMCVSKGLDQLNQLHAADDRKYVSSPNPLLSTSSCSSSLSLLSPQRGDSPGLSGDGTKRLERRIEQVQARLALTILQREEVQDRADAAEARVAELEGKIQMLARDKAEMSQEIVGLKLKIVAVAEQNRVNLDRQNEEFNEFVSGQKVYVMELEGSLAKCKEELKICRVEIEMLKKEVDYVRSESEIAKKDAINQRKEALSLREELKTARNDKLNVDAKYDDIREELDGFTQILRERQGKIEELEEEKRKMEVMMKNAIAQHQSSQQQKDMATAQILQMTEVTQSLRDELERQKMLNGEVNNTNDLSKKCRDLEEQLRLMTNVCRQTEMSSRLRVAELN